ncbi:hypothetical protein GCM10025867_03830 [Frondihabitans sucicola]|uniref:Secreted protein n=1 Tax=Frondihabitans sucicola TaxID=1268041 RepID=A0ABM8GIE9_9MICO|nr:hypothetical protein GCM10025867_03830 [Frondihabitans sucicola]
MRLAGGILPALPRSPSTRGAVAAATHTAAFTWRPTGSPASTTTTHFTGAARVDSPGVTSSGAKPKGVVISRILLSFRPSDGKTVRSSHGW